MKISNDYIPVLVWSGITIPFITLSGFIAGFNRETTWAYLGVAAINVVILAYKKLKK